MTKATTKSDTPPSRRRNIKKECDTENPYACLDTHLQQIREKIIREAEARAGDDTLSPMHLMTAAKLYAPGHILSLDTELPPQKQTLTEKLLDSLSGITIVAAILAILFGIFGVIDTIYGGQTSQGWFDVVKILVGAVVGSAGVNVAVAATRR